jgi:hypothetical protein
LLADLRGLLNEDVAPAAPLLAELTGPIVVKQGKEKVKKPDPLEAMRRPVDSVVVCIARNPDHRNDVSRDFVPEDLNWD